MDFEWHDFIFYLPNKNTEELINFLKELESKEVIFQKINSTTIKVYRRNKNNLINFLETVENHKIRLL